MFAAIYLSQTRSAVLGTLAGIAIVLFLIRPRAVLLLVLLVPAAYLLSPEPIRDRFRTGWNKEDPNTRNRIELTETSLRLIGDNPWFGVGPKNVSIEALRYRGRAEYPNWMYQHMHNNALQMAAERGIPGLVLWLCLMARLAWDGWRLFRSSRAMPSAEALPVAAAGLGSWVALMIAGLFEYNFGDSEVLALFLFMQSAAYAFGGEGTKAGGPVQA
jgi:O-antigen ligase